MLEGILADALRTTGGLLAGLTLFRLIELSFPHATAPKPKGHLAGLKIWLVYLSAQVLLTAAVLALSDSAAAGVQVDPRELTGLPTWAGAIVVGIAVVLAKDFFFYWEHRIQHRWLWRWHAPHHAIRNLSATNSWHHWSEILMFALFVSLPMSLLAPTFGPRPFLIGLLLSWQPIWIHSATQLQLPSWLRWIIIDGRYHRIHHSLEPHHFDKNFGSATPLWDWMFRTLHMPGKDEWPEVGLRGVEEPQTIRQWSSLPWRVPPAAQENPGEGRQAGTAISG